MGNSEPRAGYALNGSSGYDTPTSVGTEPLGDGYGNAAEIGVNILGADTTTVGVGGTGVFFVGDMMLRYDVFVASGVTEKRERMPELVR